MPNITARVTIVATLLLSLSVVQAFAGGPVCPTRIHKCCPPVCCPQMCAPPPSCAPPMCPQVCVPPPCAPAPMCGPAPCLPPSCGPGPCPPRCGENPLAMIVKGTVKLVVGVASLPFKVVDCLFGGGNCYRPRCYPSCNRVAMCAPPSCMPPMPPACGPACYPGMGYGMGMGRPAGFGYGAPRRRLAPFAEKREPFPLTLMATPTQGIFGSYW
jgi:hypothetical protein